MAFVTQLLALILAGYVFTVTCNLGRYWFMRKQGYELLFVTLVAGWLIHSVVALCFPGLMWMLEAVDVYVSYEGMSDSERNLAVTNGGLLVAVLLAVFVNLIFRRGGAAKHVARVSGDMIECILQRALEESRMAELAMEDGKSYVGFPLDSGITTGGDSDVTVLPCDERLSPQQDQGTEDHHLPR